ncbi:MAG TPA: type I-MYXAN CRISPR-associated endonuclease Cas1 [Bacillota bacterium]|nr:type I-MYXAN CRISPR-associated endonuclease Cas1 [Bacillota bacterium]
MSQPLVELQEKEPLIRVMALHALAYCERLFYLEEVEEIRVADASVFDGRRLHELIPEYSQVERLTLESETLGIYGKVDCVRSKKGELIPYEYKKGRSRIEPNGEAGAWPSDELQVIAYALLLEEHFQQSIKEARIYYAADHKTVIIKLTKPVRNRLFEAINQARQLRNTTLRPDIAENERLCIRCSLAPVCLPEEERLISSPERETIRLFPEDRETRDVHVTIPGSTIRKSGESIIVETRDGNKDVLPLVEVGSVTLHGPSQMTTQTLHLCAHKGIPVHWMSTGGNYIASLTNAAGGVQRRLRQYKGLTNADMSLKLSKAVVTAKIESQIRYLLRMSRGKNIRTEMDEHIHMMKTMLRKSHKVSELDELLGYEGNAARSYFSCLKMLTRECVEEGMAFTHRNKRPPKDPANALLLFLYSLLYRDCVQAIISVGLDPTISFYHQPRSSAYPLALDLMELFRVALCDMVVLGSIHRKQWNVDEDFIVAKDHVWLNDMGRKKAIGLYEKRKQDKWKHPVIGYSLSYARLLELEVKLLEKEWSGHPGLFALNRLR